MSSRDSIEELLKSKGLKITMNRIHMLESLLIENKPMTADDIYKKCLSYSKADSSTIYRSLSIFADKGIVLKTVGNDGISYYQVNTEHHCHYMICSKCHKRVSIEHCPLNELEEKIMKDTGFHITGHSLEFTGECKECIEKEGNLNK